MSTKSSISHVSWQTEHYFHIYKEMMDDKYYIETESERIEVPEKFIKSLLTKDNVKSAIVEAGLHMKDPDTFVPYAKYLQKRLGLEEE